MSDSLSDIATCACCFGSTSHQLLLQCGDVELNPGPVSPGFEQTMLEAIQSCENNVREEIRGMRQEIISIKADIKSVQDNFEDAKSEISSIKEDREMIKTALCDMKNDVLEMQERGENLQLDCEHVSKEIEAHTDKFISIEERMEHLARQSIKPNMRIFNMPVGCEITQNSLKSTVVNRVLEVASPKDKWVTDDIKYARVVGEVKDGRCPLTVVTFRHKDDKYRIYKGRENLRRDNIRVGDDLTKKQRSSLQRLKSNGQWGCYHRGKLIVVDKSDQASANARTGDLEGQRVKRSAVRKLTAAQVHATVDLTTGNTSMEINETDTETEETVIKQL